MNISREQLIAMGADIDKLDALEAESKASQAHAYFDNERGLYVVEIPATAATAVPADKVNAKGKAVKYAGGTQVNARFAKVGYAKFDGIDNECMVSASFYIKA